MASWNLMTTKEFWGCNLVPSVRKQRLYQRSEVFQQDHYPKHTSKSTQKWLKTKHWRVLKWPTMSPDVNPRGHLCRALKTAAGSFQCETPGAVCKRKMVQNSSREVHGYRSQGVLPIIKIVIHSASICLKWRQLILWWNDSVSCDYVIRSSCLNHVWTIN